MEMDLAIAFQFWVGLYERETYTWLRLLSRECASGVDVGAAQGEFTLFMLKRTEATRVIAIDPSPQYDERLKRNFILEWVSRIRALHIV